MAGYIGNKAVNLSTSGADIGGTLGVTGVVTANAGVVVDNFTLDGTTLALSSGNFTLDVAGDIIFDGDGADILFKDGGTEWLGFNSGGTMAAAGAFTLDVNGDIDLDSNNGVISLEQAGTAYGLLAKSGNNLIVKSIVSNGDLIFRGNDGGSEINALTLDMSDAGSATFNHDVYLPNNSNLYFTSGSGFAPRISNSNSDTAMSFFTNNTERFQIATAGNVQVLTGNLVIGTAGKGIDFSAQTPASGITPSAELLDHYEEGLFVVTGSLTSGTVTFNSSYNTMAYTRIGRQVTVTGLIITSAVNSPAGERIHIGSLPFTSSNLSEGAGASGGGLSWYDGTNINSRSWLIGEAQTNLAIYMDCTDLTAGDDFYISATYFTND